MREIRYGRCPRTNTWPTKGKQKYGHFQLLLLLSCFLFYFNCVGCYQCIFITN